MSGNHHHQAPSASSGNDRYGATFRVTLVGAVVNLLLSAVKIVVGIVGQSQALIADGIHSLSDLATDAMVVVAAKHGSREADENHPYGHGRIETLATVALGVILILVGAGMLWDAVRRLFATDLLLHPGVMALVVAGLSIVSKEALYQYTMVVARRVRSNLLRANAWHHRSDAVSSIVVMIGVAGTMAGLPYLDAIAAGVVALMVAKIGWDLAWHSVHELIDTGLETEQVERIRRSIMAVDGIRDMHLLRTRRVGGDALIDVHVLVDPRISVSEGHLVGETVRAKLIREFDEVSDVMIHVDPEDDLRAATCVGLPLRDTLLERLSDEWRHIPAAGYVDNVVFHYLSGQVDVELQLPRSVLGGSLERADELAAEFAHVANGVDVVRSIKLTYH